MENRNIQYRVILQKGCIQKQTKFSKRPNEIKSVNILRDYSKERYKDVLLKKGIEDMCIYINPTIVFIIISAGKYIVAQFIYQKKI